LAAAKVVNPEKVNGERFVSIEKDLEYLKANSLAVSKQIEKLGEKIDQSHAKQSNNYFALDTKIDNVAHIIKQTAITKSDIDISNVVLKSDTDWYIAQHNKAHDQRLEKGKSLLGMFDLLLKILLFFSVSGALGALVKYLLGN